MKSWGHPDILRPVRVTAPKCWRVARKVQVKALIRGARLALDEAGGEGAAHADLLDDVDQERGLLVEQNARVGGAEQWGDVAADDVLLADQGRLRVADLVDGVAVFGHHREGAGHGVEAARLGLLGEDLTVVVGGLVADDEQLGLLVAVGDGDDGLDRVVLGQRHVHLVEADVGLLIVLVDERAVHLAVAERVDVDLAVLLDDHLPPLGVELVALGLIGEVAPGELEVSTVLGVEVESLGRVVGDAGVLALAVREAAPLDHPTGPDQGDGDVLEDDLGKVTLLALHAQHHSGLGLAEDDLVDRDGVGLERELTLIIVHLEVDLRADLFAGIEDHDVLDVGDHHVGLLDAELQEVEEAEGLGKVDLHFECLFLGFPHF